MTYSYALTTDDIPADHPVRPYDTLTDMPDDARAPAMCGTCELWWDDGIVTSFTPVPSARCPFEYEHDEMER